MDSQLDVDSHVYKMYKLEKLAQKVQLGEEAIVRSHSTMVVQANRLNN